MTHCTLIFRRIFPTTKRRLEQVSIWRKNIWPGFQIYKLKIVDVGQCTNCSGLLRYAFNATLLASKGSKSGHQAKTIPNLCSPNPVVWSWHIDPTSRRHTQIIILSYIMPTPDTGCEVAGPCQEHRHSQQDRGLPNIADIISKRRQTLFGHVVRLDATTPAHHALCQIIAIKGGQSGDKLAKTSWASLKNLYTADRQRNTG